MGVDQREVEWVRRGEGTPTGRTPDGPWVTHCVRLDSTVDDDTVPESA